MVAWMRSIRTDRSLRFVAFARENDQMAFGHFASHVERGSEWINFAYRQDHLYSFA
jgi:hypothetical protein